MYEEADLSVLHDSNAGQGFQTNAGVKQGYSLSPLLFILVLNEIMSEICSKRRE